MNRTSSVARLLLLGIVLLATLGASSCQSAVGIGWGVGAPTRWGGAGTSGTPIFVGGPVF